MNRCSSRSIRISTTTRICRVGRCDDGPDVEERYVVTSGGAVEVTLTTRPARLSRTFRLERHDLASV